MSKSNLPEKKRGKPISKQAAYSKASSHFYDAIDTIIDIMHNSRNDNCRLGAANKIIDKVLPNLTAAELDGDLKVQVQNVLKYPNKRDLGTPPKAGESA